MATWLSASSRSSTNSSSAQLSHQSIEDHLESVNKVYCFLWLNSYIAAIGWDYFSNSNYSDKLCVGGRLGERPVIITLLTCKGIDPTSDQMSSLRSWIQREIQSRWPVCPRLLSWRSILLNLLSFSKLLSTPSQRAQHNALAGEPAS